MMIKTYYLRNILLVASLFSLPTLATQGATTTTTLTAYKVQSGDTLRGVANRFGLSVADLAKYNNKKTTDKLQAGEVLLLSGDDVAKVVSKIKPDALKYLSSKTATAPASTTTATTVTYSVKSGETINGIAYRNGTTPSEILRLNNLTADSKLAIGQKLLLPATAKATTKETVKEVVKDAEKQNEKTPAKTEVKTTTIIVTETKTEAKPTTKPTETKSTTKPKAVVKITDYTVVSGDSLGKLSARYNIAVSDLAKMNKLRPTDSLKIGQHILVPIAVLNSTDTKKY